MRLWEAGYPAATVSLLDMVNEQAGGEFDAAIDIMGLHMLVLDDDRKKYLKNAYSVLKSGAPMLFYKESHSEDAYEGIVATFDEWLKISGADYETATEKQVMGTDITVKIPLVPGRARTEAGYIKEFEDAGFIVDNFEIMPKNPWCPYSATIKVHKP